MISIGNLRSRRKATAVARLVAACALLFMAAALFLVSQARGALYVGTSSISTSIVRVNLDGSLFDASFMPPEAGFCLRNCS